MFVRKIYSEDPVLLHRPVFQGNEKRYLSECIDSNFVSSVGVRVTEFEEKIATYLGVKHAVATMNGTAALHVALQLAGARRGDEILTQALTFVGTCNSITYVGAEPVFVDVDRSTLGMSADALKKFLHRHVKVCDGHSYNQTTGRRIAACVPMHTFGHVCNINEIISICEEFHIPVVEDAAEALGSRLNGKHAGTFGLLGILSFNGNKIITTGGGGMILTNDTALAARAKHLTTTAKVAHPYEYAHDEIGYNYRMPNLNAALGCAQLEQLNEFLSKKRELAEKYRGFFKDAGIAFVVEPQGCRSNYWLNAVVLESFDERNQFLEFTNSRRIATRPIWKLMSDLDIFKHCQNDGLPNSRWLEERVVNIPSSVPLIGVGRVS